MAGCASDLNAAIRSFCNGNILTNEKLQIFHDILSVTSYRLPLESSLFRQTANEAKVLFTRSLTHSRAHALTYSLTHLLTYSLTHSLTHSLTAFI